MAARLTYGGNPEHKRAPGAYVALTIAGVLFFSPLATRADPSRPIPRVWVAPHGLIDLGRGAMISKDLGATIAVRVYQGWRVGAEFNHSGDIDASLEGCSTARFCIRERTRYGGRIEYVGQVGDFFHPWSAIEVGAERSKGLDMVHQPAIRKEETLLLGISQAGFDLLGTVGPVQLGGGLFSGFSVGKYFGLQVGLRVVAAAF